MNYNGETFKNQRLELSGNVFHNCRFEECELVFDGDRSPTFTDNEFIDCVFVFTEQAAKTLYFLSNIYHAGAGGRTIVGKMLKDICQKEMHGTELRTPLPNTEDHSLH